MRLEDDAEDTMVPRLMAAGADLDRVHIVDAVTTKDGAGRATFNLQTDLDLLAKKIDEVGDVALVIIRAAPGRERHPVTRNGNRRPHTDGALVGGAASASEIAGRGSSVKAIGQELEQMRDFREFARLHRN
jgi:hypothetical protein